MPKGEMPRGKASKGKGKQSKVVAPQDPSAVSNALLQQAVDELKKLSGGHLEVKEKDEPGHRHCYAHFFL